MITNVKIYNQLMSFVIPLIVFLLLSRFIEAAEVLLCIFCIILLLILSVHRGMDVDILIGP